MSKDKSIKEIIALDLFNVSIDSGEISESDLQRIGTAQADILKLVPRKMVEEILPIAFKFYDKITCANRDIATDFLSQTIHSLVIKKLTGEALKEKG